MQRRDFLRSLIGAPLLLASPVGLSAPAPTRTLVLIELSGGNDGLNTLIPRRDPLYRKHRPRVAINPDQTLSLSDTLGMHPALAPLLPWWQRGQLAWVQGLGYEQPNRSHFRSLDIWETAADSQQLLTQGWLARILEQLPRQQRDLDGVSLSSDLGPLTGTAGSVLLHDIDQFLARARQLDTPSEHRIDNPALVHIRHTAEQTRQAANRLADRLASSNLTPPTLAGGRFGKRLSLTAQLLLAGVRTPVIKLNLSSFDTHSNQHEPHARLLDQLARGLDAFARTLVQAGLWNDVLVVTYSEFGRRVIENASGGTDHGAAAPHLVMGGRVKGGLYGSEPNLKHLDDGDLRHSVDFRQLYASITRDWWGIEADTLNARRFRPLDLLRS